MLNRNIALYVDIFFCVFLLPGMIMLLPVERWLNGHFDFVAVLVIWLYAVYFINRKLTVPLFVGKGEKLYAVLILFLTVLVTFLVARYHFDGPREFYRHSFHKPPFMMRFHEQGVWFLFLVVTSFSFAVGLMTELYKKTIEKKELEQEKAKAEIALYKAQINPHFLFNTMNSIYGLILTRSDKAETAFMQFTEMVRYMYSNGDRDFIPISEEITYIGQYIELQRLRLNEHTSVEYNVAKDSDKAVIAPMLLITFVENAFKYGVSSYADSRIVIDLSLVKGKLRFFVKNRIFPERRNGQGQGMGLSNCRKRLDLLYGDKYTLNMSENSDEHFVELVIDIDGYDKSDSDR